MSTQSGNALTISRNYDSFDRLTELSNRGHSTVLDSFSYRYNATDQRVEVRGADGHRWTYSYNDLGELEKARKYHADGVWSVGDSLRTSTISPVTAVVHATIRQLMPLPGATRSTT